MTRNRNEVRIVALCLAALLVGCSTGKEADDDTEDPESNRDSRYCEILLVYMGSGDLEAEVWGTVGFNDCPQVSWEALEADAIKARYEALAAVMNGPRFSLADDGELDHPSGETRMYGDLEMGLQAILHLEIGQNSEGPYTERSVDRTSMFTYWAGSEIYELTAPDASQYVMISYSQIVNPELTKPDLAGLGSSLELPQGWTYTSRVLDEDLELKAEGETVVLQDELQNTYQLAVD